MNEFFKRLISKPITMERFNLDNFQDLGDVRVQIKESDGILQKGIHILCYKNWVENIFKNLELLRLKFLETNEDKYLDAILGVLPNSFKDFTFENQLRLQAENQELKKNVLVWHKVTCHEPDENGYITDDNPAEEGKEYLFKLKNGSVIIEELYYEDGYIVEGYSWEEIEAWAELSEM